MELEHRFELPVGIDRAWDTLSDIGQALPCLPGATVDKVQGSAFQGSLKVKFGPVRQTFRGEGRVVEHDAQTHRVRVEATGTAGAATEAVVLVRASATALAPNRTAIDLVTTLSLTGRAGRITGPMLVRASNQLIGRFADCLSNKLVGRAAGGAELVDVVDPNEVAARIAAQERAAAERAAHHPTHTSRALAGHRAPALSHAPEGPSLLSVVVPAVSAVVGALLLRKLFKRSSRTAGGTDELQD
ncbi:SRPBCC family protein [Nakamurella leprariae]|uniref:SRPBCC family protein n=1 Tax=Nakamurella leprariae TaxID=2803911 RepID=A0A939BXR6_9ACTN|nr:SRPBCC family protein [Nakamurella leprariae]MBM9468833.1 SRPBCC family protein [Nakamurella leprariae]